MEHIDSFKRLIKHIYIYIYIYIDEAGGMVGASFEGWGHYNYFVKCKITLNARINVF